MAEKLYHIRGRWIGQSELETVRSFIRAHRSRGRSAISRALCEHWDWRQSNGRLKDRACRVLLLALEGRGEVELPGRIKYNNRSKKAPDGSRYVIPQDEIAGTISDFRSLTIEMVRRSPEEGLWDHLVHEYHYLGKPWIVGSHLKYLAYLDGQVVACLGWGSAAWRVRCRDAFIGWDRPRRKRNLALVANNVRFLILPWVRVRHLASKLLAANIACLVRDWQAFYQEDLVLLETFVDVSRFRGICYRAANWIHVGETVGVAKRGNRHLRHGQPKAVYLYPLVRDFQERLNG